MQDLPHHYHVKADASSEGDVSLSADNLPTLLSAPPAEFGGPGDRWSPESLLVAAIADCFILTFRAIARGSKLSWLSLSCEVEGTLERVEKTTSFTEYKIKATLNVPADTDEQRAQRVLEKAEVGCLITNSLSGTTHLEAVVLVESS
ncbi:MAG: OsmC family peroxiredoxin [Gammaproteobacteria bacterium]|jgi:peroxiredoxin-like protein|nr:OsmC family peroxiredoxin [Gammaproteobacteria bacterium]